MDTTTLRTNACLLCGELTRLVLDLGETTLANELLDELGPQDQFPLRLVQCAECQHLQLDCHVSPSRLYGPGYVYTTANRGHMEKYAAELTERFHPQFVVDIGGNDGAFVNCFPAGTRRLNVDPASGDAPVPRVVELFGEKVAIDIGIDHGFADLITCNNCFAHNADLGPIVRGVKRLLALGGTFVLEVAYAPAMLRDGLFDLIYHEHVHYWTITSLAKYLSKFDLDMYRAEVVDTHGGSLRAFARHRGPVAPVLLTGGESDLAELVAGFPAKVKSEGMRWEVLTDAALGGVVPVVGCPAKLTTMAQYLDTPYFDHAYDDNPKKVGKYGPLGKILPMSELPLNADHLFIASWNYADELMARLKARWYNGKFIIPHPMRVVS